jgi:hypothetical protein
MNAKLMEKRPALQAWTVREAIKQFPGSTVKRLSAMTLISRAVFHRRLSELERLGFVAKDDRGGYHTIPLNPEEFPDLEQLVDQPSNSGRSRSITLCRERSAGEAESEAE